jgi:hypothetical protein
MSDTTSLSLNLPGAIELAGSSETEALDLTATHSFTFARQRWFAGASNVVRGVLLGTTGIFLLSQMGNTRNLVVQIAILGTLLTIGGAAFLVRSLSDFFGGVHLNAKAIRVRYGLFGYTVPWSQITTYCVNEAAIKSPALPSVVLELNSPARQRLIPGGHLSNEAHLRIRRLLQHFWKLDDAASFCSASSAFHSDFGSAINSRRSRFVSRGETPTSR